VPDDRAVSYSIRPTSRNAFGSNLPSCGQSPDVGTVCPFPKRKKAKPLTFSEAAGSGNLANQRFHLPQQISLATVVCRF
jgi:hypothetical protein